MENPILYVILNKELQMSAGKASAQAVHAAMMLQDNFGGVFTSSYKRTVIVLEAGNAEQIKNLSEYLDTAGLFSVYYIDEGVNEVSPYSVTALAVEPFDSDDTEKRAIFDGFNLFGNNDYDDDYRQSVGEETQNAVKRIEYGLGQLRTSLIPAPKKPNLIKRIFRRKIKGYVS